MIIRVVKDHTSDAHFSEQIHSHLEKNHKRVQVSIVVAICNSSVRQRKNAKNYFKVQWAAVS